MTLNPGELLLYESARLPHGRTSFLRFASFHLLQLGYQVKPIIWLAVSVSICGLGLWVTLFLCHLFVEPKEKTGLKPYYDRYLFLSEGRASPIYLCIFVQWRVGFRCICNWKYCRKIHFSSSHQSFYSISYMIEWPHKTGTYKRSWMHVYWFPLSINFLMKLA